MSNLTITQNKIIRDSNENVYEVQKFLNSTWRNAFDECITFDFEKFSQKIHDIQVNLGESFNTMSHVATLSYILSSATSRFHDTYPYNVIGGILSIPSNDTAFVDSISIFTLYFMNINVKGVINVLSDPAFALQKIYNSYKSAISILDAFVKEECGDDNKTSDLCKMSNGHLNLMKEDYNIIASDLHSINFLLFTDNTIKMFDECIYDRFGCEYIRPNYANKDGSIKCGEDIYNIANQPGVNVEGERADL